MNRQLSDEQLDNLLSGILAESSADERLVDQIAGSPTTWWAVKRQIEQQKQARWMPWPPPPKFLRLLMVAVPTAAVLLVTASYFAFVGTGDKSGIAKVEPSANVATVNSPAGVNEPKASDETPRPATIAKTDGRNSRSTVIKVRPVKTNFVRKASPTSRRAESVTAKTETAEIKTDFIALSYARNPESGQIVRVKVPSSMMVTLGLVATVEKPSSLVDAEVLVGDDGLTHAIRFIR